MTKDTKPSEVTEAEMDDVNGGLLIMLDYHVTAAGQGGGPLVKKGQQEGDSFTGWGDGVVRAV